jgi:hypothetical protein
VNSNVNIFYSIWIILFVLESLKLLTSIGGALITDVRLGGGKFGETLSREQQLVAPAIGKARVVPALQLWERWQLSVSKGCVSFDPGVAKPVHHWRNAWV